MLMMLQEQPSSDGDSDEPRSAACAPSFALFLQQLRQGEDDVVAHLREGKLFRTKYETATPQEGAPNKNATHTAPSWQQNLNLVETIFTLRNKLVTSKNADTHTPKLGLNARVGFASPTLLGSSGDTFHLLARVVRRTIYHGDNLVFDVARCAHLLVMEI